MILLQTHSLTNIGWFDVSSCSLTLGEKDSAITFEVGPEAPNLHTGQWLMDDEDPGKGIIYRVRSVVDNYGTKTRTVAAEHIIQTLKDTALFGEVTTEALGGAGAETVSAYTAIQYALERQSDWVMVSEDFGYNVSKPYSFNGDSVMQALETVCGTLEDCWWSYDLTVYPFHLKIRPRDTTMACEMREGRNISSIKKTIDAAGMYTRIYPIGKDNLHITGEYISRNEDIYGVIMKVETDQSCENEAMLFAWAEGRLRRHCQPNVSVQISGVDLSRETGEPLDKLQLGRACRVPLPEFGTMIMENIVKMQWRDKKKEPENVTLTLSNTVADVASIVRQERSEGGGTSGRAGRAGAKKAGEDHAWFVDTTDHVAMVAEAIVGSDGQAVNWSRVAQVVVDGQGIHGRVTQAEQDIIANQSSIEASERDISLTVKSRQIPAGNLHSYSGSSTAAFPAEGQTGHYYYYTTGSGSSAKNHYYYWNGESYVPVNVFTGLDGNLYGSYINTGEIAIAINNAGQTEAHIDAQKVILGQSTLTAEDLATWAKNPANNSNGVFAKYFYAKKVTAQSVEAQDSLDVGGILKADTGGWFGEAAGNAYVWLYQGTAHIGQHLYINQGGSIQYSHGRDGNPQNFYERSLKINGVEQAKFLASADVNFSKATSLSVEWSGGKVTMTGSPAQTPALTKSSKLSTSYLPGAATQCDANGNASATGKYIKRPITVLYETGQTDPMGEAMTASTGLTLNVMVDASSVYNAGNANRWSQISGIYTSTETPTQTLSAGQTYKFQTQYMQANGTWANGPAYVFATQAAESTVTYVEPPASALHVDPIGWYGSEPSTDAEAGTIGSYVQNHSRGWVRFDVYLDGYGNARKSYKFKIG